MFVGLKHANFDSESPMQMMHNMNQPALTKRIVDSLGLKDQRLHDVPAEPNARLTKDEDGPERKDKFHHRSSIGQLNYLTASTRPEIQFATHQLARFSENPKMSHEKAAKRVVRYSKGVPNSRVQLSFMRSTCCRADWNKVPSGSRPKLHPR